MHFSSSACTTSGSESKASASKIEARGHHVQAEFCTTRPPYRQGKELKAVKVYTINDESQHLLIHNVPSIGLLDEIRRLTVKFGKLETVELLRDYPVKAEFTHVYYVKYVHLTDARQAKKKLDNRSFFGGILHVCYAPELESVEECKKKLKDRVHSIQKKWKLHKSTVKKPVTGGRQTIASSSTISPSNTEGAWSNLIPSRIIPN